MNLLKSMKLSIGLSCLLWLGNINYVSAHNLVDIQQNEVTAAQALAQQPSILIQGTPKAIPMNNLKKGTPQQDLSKRDKKAAKLAERAAKNAEKARLKREKEAAKAAKHNKNHKQNKQAKNKGQAKGSLNDRISAILKTDKNIVLPLDYGSMGIFGEAVATKEQALAYLLMNNPRPKLSVSPAEIVDLYYEEAGREGVRPDAAFAQALKETGYFNYGGTVTPDQNNYCGLGTTSATVKGAYFATAREGVRAHIQHLLAYATVRPPQTEIVDPRYMLVRAAYGVTTIDTWPGLNGRWAVPGKNYGQEILAIAQNMANLPL